MPETPIGCVELTRAAPDRSCPVPAVWRSRVAPHPERHDEPALGPEIGNCHLQGRPVVIRQGEGHDGRQVPGMREGIRCANTPPFREFGKFSVVAAFWE